MTVIKVTEAKKGIFPLGDRVMVKIEKAPTGLSAGGFQVSTSEEIKRVVKVGPLVKNIQKGNVVLYGYSQEHEHEGETYHFVKESEIYGVIK